MYEFGKIFDRQVVRQHRDRAANNLDSYCFLFNELAERLADRLPEIKREFPVALELGSRAGLLARVLATRGGISTLIQCDLSETMLKKGRGLRVVGDEELQPFANNSFDLVLGSGSFHWINDVPGTLSQSLRSLKKDGLFLINFLGGETLKELRVSLMDAEDQTKGGVSQRVSPFVDVREAGSLLQRVGFSLPVADSEKITVNYSEPFKLLEDLRGMGESNSVFGRGKNFTSRSTIMKALSIYSERYGDSQGQVPATFEIITLTGWSPAPNQQKPQKRGSGKISMTEVFRK